MQNDLLAQPAEPRKPKPRTVLVVDDDDAMSRLCMLLLQRAGYQTESANNGSAALYRIQHNDYGAIVLDLQMPYMHGSTLLSLLSAERPEVLRKVIVATALSDAAVAEIMGAVPAVLRKPLGEGELLARVRALIDPAAPPSDPEELSSTVRTRG